MKPSIKRLFFTTALIFAAVGWLSCGDEEDFAAGRANIMGQSYSLDRPLSTAPTSKADPAKLADTGITGPGSQTSSGAQTNGLSGPGGTPAGGPVLGSLPYYCNPLRYPGNIINTAGNCRPFLDNLGSVIPSPTITLADLAVLGLSVPYAGAVLTAEGAALPTGPAQAPLDVPFAEGPIENGLEDGIIGDDIPQGGFDFPFWGDHGRGGYKKKKHRCCRSDDEENNDDDKARHGKKHGKKKKIIKRQR